MKTQPNTKTQKEIAEAVARFRKRWVTEVTQDWELEFADLLTQALEHLAKQKDEEFLGMLEDEDLWEYLRNPLHTSVRIKIDELRNKLKEKDEKE